MRELTQQEIDDAPDWATEYSIIRNHVVFIGEGRAVGVGDIVLMWADVLNNEFVSIPRKEFDITKCKFDGFSNVTIDEDFIIFEVVSSDDETTDVYIDKKFTIAAAKKFKLTGSDLK